MTKTLDDTTRASNPGRVRVSRAKLKAQQPELFAALAWDVWDLTAGRLSNRRSLWLTRIEEHLWHGDTRAAIVVKTDPLLVAAYTDELDCVAILHFNELFVSRYNLEIGSRLLTVNLYEYMEDGSYESDLIPGPRAYGRYRNVNPLIADFLTDDLARVAERKAQIREDEWRRTEMLAQSYLSENHATPRDGRPFWSSMTFEQFKSESEEPAVAEVKQTPISWFDVPKRILFVIFFFFVTLLCLSQIRRHPRLGWLGAAFFGTLAVMSMVSVFHLPRDLKNRVGVREAFSFKRASILTVTMAVSIFLGVVGEFMVDVMDGLWPSLAIWLASFVTTALFYPLRGEMKSDAPTFLPWAVYSAMCGVVSIVSAKLNWWLLQ